MGWNTLFGASCVPSPQSGIQHQAYSPVQHQEKNSNPFFVHYITGNIRVCQSWSDGSVPAAPNNIVIARLEKRPYFDKASGMWCYPQKETHSHYHLKLKCVVTAPLFMLSTLQVPPELFNDLLPGHKELLAAKFGLAL